MTNRCQAAEGIWQEREPRTAALMPMVPLVRLKLPEVSGVLEEARDDLLAKGHYRQVIPAQPEGRAPMIMPHRPVKAPAMIRISQNDMYALGFPPVMEAAEPNETLTCLKWMRRASRLRMRQARRTPRSQGPGGRRTRQRCSGQGPA